MSIYLSVDTDEPNQLASNTGWGDVCDWSEQLDVNEYNDLIHLIEHGWHDVPSLCIRQLIAAASAFPPEDKTVVSTLQNLLSLLRDAPEDSVVTINSGIRNVEDSELGTAADLTQETK